MLQDLAAVNVTPVHFKTRCQAVFAADVPQAAGITEAVLRAVDGVAPRWPQ